MAKDLEFAVDDFNGNQKIFRSFKDACEFAVIKSASGAGDVNIDVLCWSASAARAYAGDDGVESYKEDPDASVFERLVVSVNNQGRVA